ncbi:MAG: hypothetical protein CMM50_16970 [Rhodospirillaceae bacterium]|nr:hypothetical protein [Rhodospirillaceae bacterium]
MKTRLNAGSELALNGAQSVALRPIDDGDSPEVFLYRTDGTELSPDLSIGHTKVIHSKRGLSLVKNSGTTTVEVETPAPAAAQPRLRH